MQPGRGIRFAGLEVDVSSAATGLAPTGLVLDPSGGLQLIGYPQAVRQAIVMLLTTAPGERVMRPDYGCPLRLLIFSPNDATTAGLAIHYVRQALDRWEPRIDVRSLDAGPDEDQAGRLVIQLEYRLRRLDLLDQIDLSLSLEGEASS